LHDPKETLISCASEISGIQQSQQGRALQGIHFMVAIQGKAVIPAGCSFQNAPDQIAQVSYEEMPPLAYSQKVILPSINRRHYCLQQARSEVSPHFSN
jgi:hypothetical protein